MTSYHDNEYLKLVDYTLKNGVRKPNRTGVDTIGVFSYQMRFDLRDGTIPLLTTKKVHSKSIIHELLWMMSGDSNIKYLKDNGVTIWDEWADENGDLGPVYGVQWRRWPKWGRVYDSYDDQVKDGWETIDQVAVLIDKLKNNPTDRRLIISAWNVADLPLMKLPPCHYAFQFYTRPLDRTERFFAVSKRYRYNVFAALEAQTLVDADLDKFLDDVRAPKYELSLMLNQRSCDIGLGVPFNIVQYSFILRMFCEVANMAPGEFIWNGGDTHVYVNHVDALKEQLTRGAYPSPFFKFGTRVDNIDDFKYDDFVIEGYECHPTIKMEVAV